MKYMGSKRAMLQNGLGELLAREAGTALSFVDLFAGSGAVAIHVARNFGIPVFAFDLQHYSAVLAGAVLTRQARLDWQATWQSWHRRAAGQFGRLRIPAAPKLTQVIVAEFRAWSQAQLGLPVTEAYGGHYFSPWQAAWIDAFRCNLPKREPSRTVALAALIQAASQCAAAPGHTAQPFQPTRTGKPYLAEAWDKDIVAKTRTASEDLAGQYAQQTGLAEVADANEAAKQLQKGDLAFIDPPYSGVHYSRFYHVLETIARGECGEVSGVGRYPVPELRPRSRYSVGSESAKALSELLGIVSARGARAILTFPDHECSNGLAGNSVREIARRYFRVHERQVESEFSTLGGKDERGVAEAGRAPRQKARELVLLLQPK